MVHLLRGDVREAPTSERSFLAGETESVFEITDWSTRNVDHHGFEDTFRKSRSGLKRPAHDESIFQGGLVIFLPCSQDFKAQLFIEISCGQVGGTDFQKNIHRTISLDGLDNTAHDRFSDPFFPKIRMKGEVRDLNLLLDLPVDDVPDHPLEDPVDDHIGKGNTSICDLARECGGSPRVLEGYVLDLQNERDVLFLHPFQEKEILGGLAVFNRFPPLEISENTEA